MIFIYFFLAGKTYWASLTHGLMAVGFLLLMNIMDEKKLLISQISLLNSIIYFVADLFVRFNYGKTFHHILCTFGFIMALFLSPEVIIFTAKLCGLIEMTNPFWTFLRLRIDKSNEIPLPSCCTKLIAGTVYVLVFFIIRIVWFSIVLYYETPIDIPLKLYYKALALFYIMNAVFFIVLIFGFIQAIKKEYKIPK